MAAMPGAEQQVDQQKAALLAAIAQQGSQGQVAFQAEAARRQAAQQAAQADIAKRSTGMTGSAAPQALTADLQGQQAALGSIYSQDAAMSNANYDSSIAQTNASNAAYMDQARAAVPLIRAQTEGTMAQIRADLADKAAARKDAADQRAFDAQQRILSQQDQTKTDAQAAKVAHDKIIAQAQDDVARGVQRDLGPAMSKIVEDAVGISDNVPQALSQIEKTIQQYENAKDKNGNRVHVQIPGFHAGSRAELARRVYEYFTLKKAPHSAHELDSALQSEHASLSDIQPGYESHALGVTRNLEAALRAAHVSAVDPQNQQRSVTRRPSPALRTNATTNEAQDNEIRTNYVYWKQENPSGTLDDYIRIRHELDQGGTLGGAPDPNAPSLDYYYRLFGRRPPLRR